ncbi:MAG TPA: ATP-binding protein [Candidatus Binatia bacterium]|nr:ATP-binding protein [Candidatus Binatia bacterium]
MPARTSTKKSGAITGNLRPADPFELIRWLARSQNDPRKALAELVQNSLDAGARTVQIVRARARGVTALHVLDDGGGVLPELARQKRSATSRPTSGTRASET